MRPGGLFCSGLYPGSLPWPQMQLYETRWSVPVCILVLCRGLRCSCMRPGGLFWSDLYPGCLPWPQMQLYETRCALEAAEAARQQLDEENRQLTVRREDVQHRLDSCRRDMQQQVGQ